MARTSRRAQAIALLLLRAPFATAQVLSNVPTLGATSSGTSHASSAKSTAKTTAQTTGATTTSATFALTGGPSSTSIFHLSGVPTIAGAGIPTLVIPYTAGAPFMQKSSLPEGTFFIAVGATLAFLGACLLLWRLLVAWSIHRNVKRTAMASVRGGGSEKRSSSYWGPSNSSGYNPVSKGGSLYKDAGSNLSLDRLTSAGKPMKPHFRESMTERGATPPANLFFSPTAQAANRDSHRLSGHMPPGFYASPSSQPAGGERNTTIGGSLAPYANQNRHSTYRDVSPPASPSLPSQSRGSTGAFRDSTSRNSALRASSRDGLRASVLGSRDGLSSNRNSHLYAQPSHSSLMVGASSVSDLAPSRAPSAYLEDLFENHGNGPRERF